MKWGFIVCCNLDRGIAASLLAFYLELGAMNGCVGLRDLH